MKLPLRLINDRGSTLLAVLVSGVIGGIIMMGILSMIQSAHRSERHLASRLDIDDVMTRIGLFVSNGAACTSYLQNRYFNPNPTVLPSEVVGDEATDEISIFAPNDPASIIAKKDLQLGPHLKVEKLEFKNILQVAGAAYTGSLAVTFLNSSGNGPSQLVREQYLDIGTVPEVVGGITLAKIVSCNLQTTNKAFSRFSVFYANSNFTIPPQTDRVMVEVWGGGGGGAGAFSDNATYCAGGGGGGAGGYARSIVPVTPGTTYPIVVGSGGANGTGTAGGAGTNGAPGGNSSFGTLVTANGGGAGLSGYLGSVGVGGLGGSSVGQDIVTGDNGIYGDYNYSHPLGASGGHGGRGAHSIGNGGLGGYAFLTPAHRSGHPGTAGRVIVWW